MRKAILSLAIAVTALTMSARPAFAVDTSNHILGLGADASFSSEGILPQLSVKFGFKPHFELALLLGMSIAGATNNQVAGAAFTPGVKFDYVLIPEKYMNFYMQASASVDLRTDIGLNAVLYGVGPGVEFFLSEMPNLGIALEFGLRGSVAVTSPDRASVAIQFPDETTTNLVTAFGGAGIHYYF